MGLGISLEAEGRSAEARDAFQRARASNSLSPELDRFVEQKIK
jgi:MSHA biogenesis protein MshN